MATFILQAAGAAIGTAIGGPVGGIVGRLAGAVAGGLIDSRLFGSSGKTTEGPRLSDLNGISSTEGAPVPRVYGKARLGGQVIWATQFEEVVSTSKVSTGGGKGLSSSSKQTTYSYYANVAIALCEGPVAFVRRVWADGDPLDLTKVTMRVYTGSENQLPDPLIVAKEGSAFAPAYRGTAYVVFERLPLEDYGNRLPQLSFEVVAPVPGLPNHIRAVNIIPGSGEFTYETVPVSRSTGYGATQPENRNQYQAGVDWAASLDQLQALCPNLRSVSLVAAWFGDDLRAGNCTVAPRIDVAGKVTTGGVWQVGNLMRSNARLVSQINGRAAYGGTPSDHSVVSAIRDLKARGLEVVLYPFVMMDIPTGNGLPNPLSGDSNQPAYAWRGRISCFPAPGISGSPDGSAEAAAEVAAFFGTAAPGDFDISSGNVIYSGPDEWSFRRHILHYAHLAVIAGSVDAFIIGSELVGLTRVQSAPGVYPAVAALQALASDVRSVLGPGRKITYAADWTEYGSHVTASGDVYFPLDPLWGSSDIDMVSIDWYVPLSDWRDGRTHADAAISPNDTDLGYLISRVASGEGYDFYYASDADRYAQNRLPITDGLGKPWLFRPKDLVGWWFNQHFSRVGGAESAMPTPWVPGSKPIWLTEMGCPAVDRGANSPNVFPDPKAEAPQIPYFSRGIRDDLAQTRAIEATLSYFDPALPAHPSGANPSWGGTPMVDPNHIVLWCWDARPFPAFPYLTDIWSDGDNWANGHWLNGRIEGVPLDMLVSTIAADMGDVTVDASALTGFVDGYTIDRTMSGRDAIEPLATLFGFDAVERDGVLTFATRDRDAVATLTQDDLVPDRNGQLLNQTRAQESELPRAVSITFVDAENDYRSAAVTSRRIEGSSRSESRSEIAVATRRAMVQRLADALVQESWVGRESLAATLRPGLLGLETGDTVTIQIGSEQRLFRLSRVTDSDSRQIEANAIEPTIRDLTSGPAPLLSVSQATGGGPPLSALRPTVAGPPYPVVVDLPTATSDTPPLQYLAVAANPWPRGFTLWRSSDGAIFQPVASVEASALLGQTTTALPPGPLWRIDHVHTLGVSLSGEGLASIDPLQMLAGDNTLAVQYPDGLWELIGFADATLVGTRQYTLGKLLRGLGASEARAARILPAGSPVVLVDRTMLAMASGTDDLYRSYEYRLTPSGTDLGDPAMVSFTVTAGPIVLQPFAPVGAKAKRSGGAIDLSWIRRTRRGGDSWDLVEVPLSEEREAYEVDILSGSTVLRTLICTTPTVAYADELTDFGATLTSISVVIYQLSATVGRGLPLAVTLPVN